MNNTQYLLKHPVKLGTLPQVTVLEIQPLRGKHLRGLNLQNISTDDLMELCEKLTNQTTSFIDEMHASDVLALFEIVGNLLGSSLETGETA